MKGRPPSGSHHHHHLLDLILKKKEVQIAKGVFCKRPSIVLTGFFSVVVEVRVFFQKSFYGVAKNKI